ncbi:HAMP domain-containing protein [Labilibacter sediminis]|nr:HAMP domain-containing protein [Labilibacter sediminis]
MHNPKKFSFLSWQYILLAASVIMVMLLSWAFYNYNHHSFNALRFKNALHQKSREANSFTTEFTKHLNLDSEWHAIEVTEKYKPDGVEVLVYKSDSLHCWTSQVLPYENEDISLLMDRVTKLGNTWYLIEKTDYQDWDIFTLVSIKTEYPFDNAFLKDEYAIKLPLVLCHDILVDEGAEGVKINDQQGNYLFTAIDCGTTNPLYANWAVVFVFISLLLFVQVVISTVKKQKTSLRSIIVFVLSLVASSLLYWIHVSFQVPGILFSVPLFSPVYFGASELFPNLGSLLIFSVLLFAESFVLYKHVLWPKFVVQLPYSNWRKFLIVSVLVLLSIGFWHVQNQIVTLLISNSASMSLLFRITNLRVYEIVKIFIICLLWLSVVLVLEKIITAFLSQLSRKKLSIIALVAVVLASVFSFKNLYLVSLLIFLVVVLMLIWVRRRKSYHAYTTFIWFIFVFAFYGVYTFYYHNFQQEREERKLLIENLSFRLIQEEDPLTEMLLKEDEDFISQDSVLISQLQNENINVDAISKYIDNRFLSGYLQRYDLQVIPCWPGGDVHISAGDSTSNCYDYFERMLLENGTKVMGSRQWYFLSNQAGVITYFGVFKFFEGDLEKETSLYLELVAKPFFEGPGYPELLLSERESKLREPLINYSYGKYVDGLLVKQVGEFTYPIHLYRITDVHDDFHIFNHEDYSHITYHPSKSICIVLSIQNVNFSIVLVTFSLFFISFFIFGALIIMMTRIRKGSLIFVFSVQERIQIAFIGLMLALLVLVAGGSVWQTMRRFEVKNNQILSEKTKSVLMELEHKIGNQDELTEDMHEYVSTLLKKFSSVFYTDLNLFGTDGRLIASSRPELFDKGLSGHLMNSKGFIELHTKGEVEFIHKESIGELEYLSAYVPFLNEDNKVLAYLNMPYFVGTSELREEISSLVMAILNFYLIFLIMVIGLTVVVARRITHPLLVVQNKLGQLELGGRNEKIEYKGNDEIGQLVTEYNRMVDEIAGSAEKLAKSERESAWREMARQIAHEIKNPLTPMKLSIQYLEMAKQNNDPQFDEKLKKVSSTLINQIDKLSSIASEFSNFAKMPIAKRKKVNVVEILIQCTTLFDKSHEANIIVSDINTTEYYIFADVEQLISVFNNLLKNALQSIPHKREGIINVNVTTSAESIVVEIKDNGLGIPKDVQEKLFAPNFTTKSSGMGLGLAIVKNIVVNSKGKIWFKTREDFGTSFFVEFPAYEE